MGNSNEQITTSQPPVSVAEPGDQGVVSPRLIDQLQTRVVREARRDTWFVVNASDDDIATIPVAMRPESSIRRVHVNGEVTEFSASQEEILVRPHRPLRKGAGTIVVVHFR